MGNQLRKSIPKEDMKYLEEHTQFRKQHIMDFYKDFMVSTCCIVVKDFDESNFCA